jgi:hypothetical protein
VRSLQGLEVSRKTARRIKITRDRVVDQGIERGTVDARGASRGTETGIKTRRAIRGIELKEAIQGTESSEAILENEARDPK